MVGIIFDPNKETERSLVGQVIEKALLNIGPECHELVLAQLYSDYNCKISDCYENPEYLKRILRELFGNSYDAIIESINQQLRKQEVTPAIENFLLLVNKI